MIDLFRNKAGNATKRLATMAHSLLGALLVGSGRVLRTTCGGFSDRRGSLAVLVLPPKGLVERGGVIDQTPNLKKIKNPANGANITNESLTGISEGELSGRVVPVLLDDVVAIVHVKPRILGR